MQNRHSNDGHSDSEKDQEFADLIKQASTGSNIAAKELVDKYGTYVLRAVRRRLRVSLRAKFDSQDFAQAVWTSFFNLTDELQDVEKPDQLIRLLVTMAKHKVIDEGRKRETKKYCVKKETYLDDIETNRQQQIRSREPSPSQFAIAKEEWDRLYKDCPQQHLRVLEMKLAGETHRSIAQELKISEKTVQRVLGRLLRERNE